MTQNNQSLKSSLDAALTVLLYQYELYTKFVLSTIFVADEKLPACMGIRPLNTHLEIRYNPKFIEQYTLKVPELVQILRHEYGHIILHHVWSHLPNHVKSNVAADIEINQQPWVDLAKAPWVKQFGCTPERFKLPEKETREYYYTHLPENNDNPNQKNGEGNDNQHSSTDDTDTPSQVDNHGSWAATETQMSEETWRKVVQDALTEAKSRGTISDKVYELITSRWKKVTPLNAILRRIIGRHIALALFEQSTRKRPNRRFKLAPGSHTLYTPHIVWAFDTSGSMHTTDLQLALGVLRWVNRKYPVSIIQCDAGVTSVQKNVWKVPKTMAIKGRGGTSFVPVFEFIKNKWNNQVDVLIFISDLAGEFPQTPPPYPVVWLATTSATAPFGKTIVINREGR